MKRELKSNSKKILAVILALCLVIQGYMVNAFIQTTRVVAGNGELAAQNTEDLFAPFYYTMFAGNEETQFYLDTSITDIKGDIHTNNKLRMSSSMLKVDGIASAVTEIQTSHPLDNEKPNSAKINMPDVDAILAKLDIGDYDEYDEDLFFGTPNTVFNKSMIVHGELTIDGIEFQNKGHIIADSHITMQNTTNDLSNNAFICSKSGDITINGSVSTFHGIIFAPNGTVKINASIFNLKGRIIADKIIFNGSILYGESSDSELELINQPPIVDAGEDQTIYSLIPVQLAGKVEDDGILKDQLTMKWTVVSGEGNVTFIDDTDPLTKVNFDSAGTYILKLTANDGLAEASDTVKIIMFNGYINIEPEDPDPNPNHPIPGESINLIRVMGKLQISEAVEAFNFVWVANSSKGTVVKINAGTGDIIGEYRTSPDGEPGNPSRTTVDKDGNVWVANRDGNSVTRIGLAENGQWIDKNGNGKLDTSTGLGDVKGWTNADGADTNGGVSTAEDECIITYTRTSSPGTRHVSVDGNNDVWVSGTGNRIFDLIDGETGNIIRTEGSVNLGGYGGLIDKNNVIWSANPMLRWDTSKSLTGPPGTNYMSYSHYNTYGMALDKYGNVWVSSLGEDAVRKFSPSGILLGTFRQGNIYAQGLVADQNGDIWVAHSLYENTVGHLKNDGTYVGTVDVGEGPTGVAVDKNGKIWVTGFTDGIVCRIDPNLGPIGDDGVTRVGEVDFKTVPLGGNLYNYSDMTGSTLTGRAEKASWTTISDSEVNNLEWGEIKYKGEVYGDGSIVVHASTSNDNINFTTPKIVENGKVMDIKPGRYIKISAYFIRSSDGLSPALEGIEVAGKGHKFEMENESPIINMVNTLNTNVNQSLVLKPELKDDCMPNGNSLYIEWSTANSGVTFSSKRKLNPKVTFARTGIYTLTLKVGDGAATVTKDVTVVVQ